MTRLPEEMVAEFHERFGCHIETVPTMPPYRIRVERSRLIAEEAVELITELLATDDPAEQVVQADAISAIRTILTTRLRALHEPASLERIANEHGDVAYVNSGGAVNAGIPLTAVVAKIHDANMRKLDERGRPIINEHGKAMKPENWLRADIAAVLVEARVLGLAESHGDTCPGCDRPLDAPDDCDHCEYFNLLSGRIHYCGRPPCYCWALRGTMKHKVLDSFIPPEHRPEITS